MIVHCENNPMMNFTPYKENFILVKNDCLVALSDLKRTGAKFNMIFADPPYNLSNDGMSCHAGRRVSVNKGAWDKSKGFEQDSQFILQWLGACREVLKENGTIWVSGTLHNIHIVGWALQKLGFHILNDIAWFKPNGPPNLACRSFAHAHETLIWAKKSKNAKHYFDYKLMKTWDHSGDLIKNEGRQMRSVWAITLTPKKEKTFGKHPTQKPEELLTRIILSSTQAGDLILDPFCGSGTTGVVAIKHERKFVGIDTEEEFLELAEKRILNVRTSILEEA